MTNDKWLHARWSITESKRRARFYTITAAGESQLAEEERRWKGTLDLLILKILARSGSLHGYAIGCGHSGAWADIASYP